MGLQWASWVFYTLLTIRKDSDSNMKTLNRTKKNYKKKERRDKPIVKVPYLCKIYQTQDPHLQLRHRFQVQ